MFRETKKFENPLIFMLSLSVLNDLVIKFKEFSNRSFFWVVFPLLQSKQHWLSIRPRGMLQLIFIWNSFILTWNACSHSMHFYFYSLSTTFLSLAMFKTNRIIGMAIQLGLWLLSNIMNTCRYELWFLFDYMAFNIWLDRVNFIWIKFK